MTAAFTGVLEGDLSGSSFTAAPTWTDYTNYLLDDPGVELSWGRQDKRSQVDATTFTLELDNSTGLFTTGASPVHVGHRFRFRVTCGGTTYTRCTGYVTSAVTSWRGDAQGFATLQVSCVDVSSPFGTKRPLRSMVEEEILADSPTYFLPLGEGSGSTTASNIAPNGTAKATRFDIGAGGTCDFGTEMGLVENTGVYFGSSYTNRAVTGPIPGSVLAISHGSAKGPFIPSVGPFALEVWFVSPRAAATGDSGVIWMQSNLDGTQSVAFTVGGGGNLFANLTSKTSDWELATPASICDHGLHQAVITLDATSQLFTFYVDGEFVDQVVQPSGFAFNGFRYNLIGGQLAGGFQGTFPGAVALIAQYPSELSAGRVLAHYEAGPVDGTPESSQARFSRLLGFAGLTSSSLPTGIAVMGGQATRDKTLTDTLRQVAATEGTACYVTPDGDPTFQARNQRYWPTSAFTLSAGAAATVGRGLQVREDKDELVNDQTATRDGGGSYRVQNQASIDANGRSEGDTLQVSPSTDFDAKQNAAWRVATGKDPVTRISSVSVNLNAQAVTTGLAQSLLQATISTPFTLDGLPSQTPGGPTLGMFIEGGQETWTTTQGVLQFFTSSLAKSGVSFSSGTSTPNLPNTLRVAATGDEGSKLDAGLLIPF